MIRRITGDDIDAVVEFGRRGHDRSAHARFEYDVDKAKLLVAKLAWMRDGIALMAEHDGEVTGVLLGHVTTPTFVRARVATDIAFYAEHPGDGRELLKAFEKWAREREADEILIGVSFGGRRSDKYYERKGYTTVGGVYIKGVGHEQHSQRHR